MDIKQTIGRRDLINQSERKAAALLSRSVLWDSHKEKAKCFVKYNLR